MAETKELIGIEKIGLIMFGLLGDVLMRTSLIEALIELYPNSKITAICDANTKIVFKNNDLVDEFIVFDRNNKNKIKKNIGKLKGFWSVRKAKFDLLIDLYNGGSSPFIVSISNAKHRLGYAHQKDKKVYNLLSDYVPYTTSKIDSYNYQIMSILRPLSEKKFSLFPVYKVSDEILEQTKVPAKNYVLNFGTGGLEKLLEFEKYIELVRYIYEKYNYIPLVVLNPGQEYLQESFIKEHLLLNNIPYTQLGLLSIEEVAALLTKSSFVITPDTGIMHLAFAVDTFVYTPFTYTNPDLVDLGSEKFIPVYEHFEAGVLGQKQDIKITTLLQKADFLFEKLNHEN